MRSWTSVALVALNSQLVAAQNITSDTYFYGQSPPVYPSPQQQGIGSWAEPHTRAVQLVSQMTLEEKINVTLGIEVLTTGCAGQSYGVPRLGYPGLCVNNAGQGVGATDYVNAWPSALHVGATWNRNLTYQIANGMGGEFKRKGVHIALGPLVAPLGRVTLGGRNWEGFSVDPYLSGQLVAETVTGVQDAGVTTSTKHFIGYEQETNRLPSGDVSSVSSNIDDKTLHETYLWPFADALRAGTGCIMCSYNRLNNSYACQNSKSLNGILKTELGFEGFVMSDWFAQHSGGPAANAGLDMVMPFDSFDLPAAVDNGSVEASRIDDMATRIVATWYQQGQDTDFPPPGIGMPFTMRDPHPLIDARSPSSKPILLNGAIEGHVLVKNFNNALPLKSPKSLGLYGYDAVAPRAYNVPKPSDLFFSAWNLAFESANLTEGLIGFGGVNGTLVVSQIAPNGTLWVGGGSGGNNPSYISAPYDAISQRAYEDNTYILWDFESQDPAVDGTTEACLVFINAMASESFDRVGLRDKWSDTLVDNVANSCSNTIVVIHSAGVRLVDSWIDHPNITAVILAHLPGQDSGRALVSLLYGDVSPSGRLPYTLAKNESDYAVLSPTLPEPPFQDFPQSDFTEGDFLDYKHFDKYNITPRYEFGFGLSYTTFEYSNLQTSWVNGCDTSALPPAGTILQGGLDTLWTELATVSATVTNTGDFDSSEVAQLYIGIPGGPIRQLRGFEKTFIQKGDSTDVEFQLMRRDLSEWDAVAQQWVLPRGEFGVYVGRSSRDLPLVGSLKL